MAAASHCQRSYLSRALKGEVLLTPDHLHGLCEYWRLSEDESEYLLLLLEKVRAANAGYRARIERKIAKILSAREDLARRLETPAIAATERELLYYSSWHWAAIHMCTAVPKLQTESAISQALHVQPELIRQTLHQLADWGFCRRSGQRWLHAGSNLHVPRHSPLVGQHHQQWRTRAIEDSQISNGEGLHYTQIQAMSETAFRKIKGILLASIEETLKVADAAKEEKVVTVTIDAFGVA
jgi:hypothetical protein